MKLNSFDIFWVFFVDILDLSSAPAYRIVSFKDEAKCLQFEHVN